MFVWPPYQYLIKGRACGRYRDSTFGASVLSSGILCTGFLAQHTHKHLVYYLFTSLHERELLGVCKLVTEQGTEKTTGRLHLFH